MSLGNVLRFLGLANRESEEALRAIAHRRQSLSKLGRHELDTAARSLNHDSDVVEIFAFAAFIAERELALSMFNVQLAGALAMRRGHIAELGTGEGKTLAAVPAVVWFALRRLGVHVLTANDYLARRDALWMRPVYEALGLSVSYISQSMTPAERRAAYACDVTYATSSEVGFDYLRDGLARAADELVHRPFAFALFDEADSLLIDEARIPLVIAGGLAEDPEFAHRIDAIAISLRPGADYYPDEFARNVQLTDAGIQAVEQALGCGSLFDSGNLRILTAVQDSLQAHTLLRRDVDYVVRNDSVELVDAFKGRIVQDRRWPAGLQSAIEAKEKVALKKQGRILGSVTVQCLAGMYEQICGMTGTAATQADEFWKIYKLPVEAIPPNRQVIRQDFPDIVYADKAARARAVVEEIRKVHSTGRPVLVGTASVEESEYLSDLLAREAIEHSVLNARNDDAEARIVSQAGALRAVTISTNMAGRGTDILLGGNPPTSRDAVVALGGLYVIGTTRHEARRIDNQLRGRAGRQGDPGASRFFISLEDDLLVRFGIAGNPDIDSVQRTAESQNLEIRQMLWKYESVVEHHRLEVYALRREVLLSKDWTVRSLLPDAEELSTPGDSATRRVVLSVIDDLWADYLANVAELRGGIHWVSWGGRDPLYEFLTGVERIYADFHRCLAEELPSALASPADAHYERGATWTYMTTDQPFGTLTERIMKGIRRKMSGR